jgi:hypothetical protein
VTVLRGFPLSLETDEFMEAQGEGLRRPSMSEAAVRAVAEAAGIVEPAVTYRWVAVERRDARRVEVGGEVLTLGRHADLLRPAQEAFVAVVTIGGTLEERTGELHAAGRALDSYLLDAVGVYAVGKCIETARMIVESQAAERGWGVGPELAPGQLSGWAIAEQKRIARLLDLDAIGVKVTESGMLVPVKSASMLVGAGPDYEAAQVGSPCAYCSVSETCRYRH